MRARSFFYASLGVLALALAYHFGATTATAQAPGNAVVALAAVGASQWALTSQGDVYATSVYSPTWSFHNNVLEGSGYTGKRFVAMLAYGHIIAIADDGSAFFHPGTETPTPWTYFGNAFSGGPTSARQESFGQLKARYRGAQRESMGSVKVRYR